ncbi:MAG: hypothetical protein PHO90_03060 [Candidatus Pacebacteria bacterium]|nr:hypothetical protein [Candidatus Paceibacterota bacterium]
MKRKETLKDVIEDIFFVIIGLVAFAVLFIAVGVEKLQEKKKPVQ